MGKIRYEFNKSYSNKIMAMIRRHDKEKRYGHSGYYNVWYILFFSFAI